MEEFTDYQMRTHLPYDPKDVDIRQQHFAVGHVMEMIKHNDVELWRPHDFQRLSGLWSLTQKSRLIESLIMRIPLPMIYFDGSNKPWKIIDGLQRLTVLDEFINKNGFVLKDLEYLKELQDKPFSDLPFSYQRSIMNADLTTYIINPGTPESVKHNIFQRINTGGVKLRPQEIRNGYFSGAPVKFLDRLLSVPSFQRLADGKIPPKRMKDKEFILRFFAFYKYLDLYEPPMDGFLDFAMGSVGRFEDHELDEIVERFDMAMLTCWEIFGDSAFFLLNMNGQKNASTPNIALFEIWAVNLAKLTESENLMIRSRGEEVKFRFVELLQNTDFSKAITSKTTTKEAVMLRFHLIADLLYSITDAH